MHAGALPQDQSTTQGRHHVDRGQRPCGCRRALNRPGSTQSPWLLHTVLPRRAAVEDLDGPKTVEEKVARNAKIRVFKQFGYGVLAYVATTLAVILLPIFVSPEVRRGAGPSHTAVLERSAGESKTR